MATKKLNNGTVTLETVTPARAAWYGACEDAVCNFAASEEMAGMYKLQAQNVFGSVPEDTEFSEFEEKRVYWGKMYREERTKISQDAVDAAFNRFMRTAYAHLNGGYKKPKAKTNDAERVGKARSEKQEKAATIAATYAPEEIAQKVVELSTIVANGKGKEKTEARTERSQMEAAMALITKTATESAKIEEKQLNEVWKGLTLDQKRLALSII